MQLLRYKSKINKENLQFRGTLADFHNLIRPHIQPPHPRNHIRHASRKRANDLAVPRLHPRPAVTRHDRLFSVRPDFLVKGVFGGLGDLDGLEVLVGWIRWEGNESPRPMNRERERETNRCVEACWRRSPTGFRWLPTRIRLGSRWVLKPTSDARRVSANLPNCAGGRIR